MRMFNCAVSILFIELISDGNCEHKRKVNILIRDSQIKSVFDADAQSVSVSILIRGLMKEQNGGTFFIDNKYFH